MIKGNIDANNTNKFSNNHKTKLLAGEIYDGLPYLKKAHSYMTQGELEGKKYGKNYTIYLPDAGTVQDGLVADPDSIKEVEVEVTLENKNTSVEVDAWNKMNDIESFTNEIAKPKGRKLARSVEKDAIDKTIDQTFQAVVGSANFKTLTDASKALDEVSVDGTKVTFIKPTVAGTISNGGLANFIPSEIQTKIYKDAYLGQYAGASVIEENLLPVINVTAATGTKGAEYAVTAISGEGALSNTVVGFDVALTPVTAYNGQPVAFPAKVIGVDGMETDQDVVLTVSPKMPSVRVAVEGYNPNNANAWIPASDVASFTGGDLGTILPTGKYARGICRTEDAVGFDKYSFGDLEGWETSTESVANVTLKATKASNPKTMESFWRLDLPYAVCLPEPRRAVGVYMKID